MTSDLDGLRALERVRSLEAEQAREGWIDSLAVLERARRALEATLQPLEQARGAAAQSLARACALGASGGSVRELLAMRSRADRSRAALSLAEESHREAEALVARAALACEQARGRYGRSVLAWRAVQDRLKSRTDEAARLAEGRAEDDQPPSPRTRSL